MRFLAHDNIYAVTCYMLSPVHPSVWRLSHGWISQKCLKLGSCNFHHWVAPWLVSSWLTSAWIPKGTGALNKRGVGKIGNFQPISRHISDMTKVTINDYERPWTAISSGDLGGYFVGNVRDKASNITWHYATPCLMVIDRKMNDLEWLFHVKICFRQQGCHTLIFTLARLHCYSGHIQKSMT